MQRTINNALQRTERYKLRSMAMMGEAHLLESITAPSASDDFSDSDSSPSSDSDSDEEEEQQEDVSNSFVTILWQWSYNA